MIADPTSQTERMIKGCQVFMPETVFFKDDGGKAGKIDFITSMDRDFCLTFDTKTKAMNVNKKLK